MGEIFKLMDEMEDELQDAMKYAKCYQKYKNDNPMIAKKFYDMSQDEIKHSVYLHDIIVDKINDEEETQSLEAIWEYRHGKYVDTMTEIKLLLAM